MWSWAQGSMRPWALGFKTRGPERMGPLFIHGNQPQGLHWYMGVLWLYFMLIAFTRVAIFRGP